MVSAALSASPTETTATVPPGLTRTSTGPVSRPPLSCTAFLNEASAWSNGLPRTADACTTTSAGEVLLGKAASIAL